MPVIAHLDRQQEYELVEECSLPIEQDICSIAKLSSHTHRECSESDKCRVLTHNAAMFVRPPQRMGPLDKLDLSIIENCAHSLRAHCLIENYTSTTVLVERKVDGHC